MARDYTLITAILGIVIRALFAYQRRMARRAGHRGAKCASVTFVQRFGGALNLNVHLHVLLPDAVFLPGETEDDELVLLPLAPPEDKDIQSILEKVVRRVSALVPKRCGIEQDFGIEPETDVLDGAVDEAMRKVPRLPWSAEDEAPEGAPHASRTGKRAMRLQGFSLHANTAVAADAAQNAYRFKAHQPPNHHRVSAVAGDYPDNLQGHVRDVHQLQVADHWDVASTLDASQDLDPIAIKIQIANLDACDERPARAEDVKASVEFYKVRREDNAPVFQAAHRSPPRKPPEIGQLLINFGFHLSHAIEDQILKLLSTNVVGRAVRIVDGPGSRYHGAITVGAKAI